MALADTIFMRRGRPSARLPGSPGMLRGPRTGVVVLPVHLSWHGYREFDVAEQERRLILYGILLSQGRRSDIVRFVNAERLAADWPALRGLLSRRTREAAERRLGLGG